MRSLALTVAVTVALVPAPSLAQSDAPRRELRYDLAIDGSVTLVTGLGWIVTEAIKSSLAPEQCRWCARNGLDDSVTRALGWSNLRAGSTVGDVGGFAVTPLAVLGALTLAANSEDRLDEMPVNALLVVETIAVSSALNQLVKFNAGRERPFVAELSAEAKAQTDHPADNNLSFYSGHSNLVFALAVSSGTIAHLRGYKAEPYIWGVGLPLATFVAYSRIAAKKHYLTDVLLGSATGAAFGFALPWLFHQPKAAGQQAQAQTRVTPLPNGLALSGQF